MAEQHDVTFRGWHSRGVLPFLPWAAWLAIGCASSSFTSPAAAPTPSTPPPPVGTAAATSALAVQSVGCVGLTVSSIDRVAPFYEQVLTFRSAGDTVLSGPALEALDGIPGERVRRRRLTLGTECVELSEPLAGVRRPIPPDSASNDLWFQHVAIVVRDMDAAYARLEQNHVVHVSTEPQTLPAWNKNAANIRAFYFKDPDGHTLELIWFPPDKGQARWHSPPGTDVFLGIDHTAIASSDTDASLAFYVGKLGMRVAGGSDNYGVEQEHLSGVPGAHVRITTLRAPAGPGVELLQYLSPTGGRRAPADQRADDLSYWRTTMTVAGLDAPRALRDPDGHRMETSPR